MSAIKIGTRLNAEHPFYGSIRGVCTGWHKSGSGDYYFTSHRGTYLVSGLLNKIMRGKLNGAVISVEVL